MVPELKSGQFNNKSQTQTAGQHGQKCSQNVQIWYKMLAFQIIFSILFFVGGSNSRKSYIQSLSQSLRFCEIIHLFIEGLTYPRGYWVKVLIKIWNWLSHLYDSSAERTQKDFLRNMSLRNSLLSDLVSYDAGEGWELYLHKAGNFMSWRWLARLGGSGLMWSHQI